jgi:ribose 5-phosphate isomerase B
MERVNEIIPITADQGGFKMKSYLIDKMTAMGYNMLDFGTNSEASVDYPDMVHPLAKAVNDGVYLMGIILCGSGNGAQITANKYPNVRAALCWNVEIAALARKHNDANIISLPGRFVSNETAMEMVKMFLATDFEGGRHELRVEKISKTLKSES